MIAWGIAGLVWLTVAVLVISERKRPRDELTYSYSLPQPKGLVGSMQAFARAFESLTWGSSVLIWRRRCDASLKASRRRRGLDV